MQTLPLKIPKKAAVLEFRVLGFRVMGLRKIAM
jgi:hypothetical protein